MATTVELSDAIDRTIKKLNDFKGDVRMLLTVLDASWDLLEQGPEYNRLADAADEVRKWLK